MGCETSRTLLNLAAEVRPAARRSLATTSRDCSQRSRFFFGRRLIGCSAPRCQPLSPHRSDKHVRTHYPGVFGHRGPFMSVETLGKATGMVPPAKALSDPQPTDALSCVVAPSALAPTISFARDGVPISQNHPRLPGGYRMGSYDQPNGVCSGDSQIIPRNQGAVDHSSACLCPSWRLSFAGRPLNYVPADALGMVIVGLGTNRCCGESRYLSRR
jgi:hypothetical protein